MTPEQQKMVDSKLYTRQPAGEPPVRSSELVRLLESAIQLNEIVEGVRNNQWVAGGRRLKDTPEWCAFYVSLNRAIEQSNVALSGVERKP